MDLGIPPLYSKIMLESDPLKPTNVSREIGRMAERQSALLGRQSFVVLNYVYKLVVCCLNYVYIYIYIYIHMHTHTCVYVYVYIHTYI